jgi:hypothetical protein
MNDDPVCEARERARNEQARLDAYCLTREQFEAMLKFQDGKCALCGQPLEKPQIDHCHKTGLVRGLLCWRCNGLGLGNLAIEFLQRALEYLLNPPAIHALGYEHLGIPGRVGTKKARRLLRKRRAEDAKIIS